ncbi:hypothetical protein BBF96_02295 [Anoxybacter fermentans]|uniref:Peptidase M50 domain-containing protein n=1 Tax=Anoxybacter fermentans TaxID=1323375 RepID=A0A3S9T2L7_9FIRM|nr:hypothetical protein BBF96_02295 [Anoxybacter fermentans]
MILGIPVFLLSLSIHEFAHGKVADLLGDPTPRWMGRLTLDPRAHIDPFGLIVLLLTQRIGWAKPVPVNPTYFKNPRKGMLYVGLAGPLSNLTLAIMMAIILHVWRFFNYSTFGMPFSIMISIFDLIRLMLIVNVALAVFNLLPFPPLDGSRILAGLLPSRQAYILDYLEGNIGMMILFMLAMTGILGKIISPIIWFVIRLMGL